MSSRLGVLVSFSLADLKSVANSCELQLRGSVLRSGDRGVTLDALNVQPAIATIEVMREAAFLRREASPTKARGFRVVWGAFRGENHVPKNGPKQ